MIFSMVLKLDTTLTDEVVNKINNVCYNCKIIVKNGVPAVQIERNGMHLDNAIFNAKLHLLKQGIRTSTYLGHSEE